MSKRKLCIIPIIIGLLVALSACGPRSYVNKFNIKTSYKEWAKQIGLYSTEKVKVSCYDGDNEISLGLRYEDGTTGYKELCDIVNAHNRFVDENPDYFPNDIKITIHNRAGGEQPNLSTFSNVENERYGIGNYVGDLKRPYTAKIQYLTLDMKWQRLEIEENKIEIDVPVIIMQSNDESYVPRGQVFEFLKDYKSAKQVIMDFVSEHDKDEICKEIHEYLPDVEVYDVVHVTGQDYLEKCQ